MSEYRIETDYKNKEKLNHYIKNLIPQFLGVYFKNMEQTGRSTATMLEYARELERFFNWLHTTAGFKDEDLRLSAPTILDQLSTEDFNEYFDYRFADKKQNNQIKRYSANTLSRTIAVFKSVYKFYYSQELIQKDMSYKFATPKKPKPKIRALDVSEVDRLLKAVADTTGLEGLELAKHELVEKRDIAILTTLFGTGLRVSELVGIDLDNIDFKRHLVRVVRKGGYESNVYFPMNVQNAIQDYIQNGRNLLSPARNETALFVSTHHKRITVRGVELLIKKYSIRAGLSNPNEISPHKARSTYATNLYNESNDIYMVAEALGHSSPDITAKHYAKVSEDNKRLASRYATTLFINDDDNTVPPALSIQTNKLELDHIHSIMDSLNVDIDKAMDILKIDNKKRDLYRKMLENK